MSVSNEDLRAAREAMQGAQLSTADQDGDPGTNSAAGVLMWLLAVASGIGALICFAKAKGALAGLFISWGVGCLISAVFCIALALIAADAARARAYAKQAMDALRRR